MTTSNCSSCMLVLNQFSSDKVILHSPYVCHSHTGMYHSSSIFFPALLLNMSLLSSIHTKELQATVYSKELYGHVTNKAWLCN